MSKLCVIAYVGGLEIKVAMFEYVINHNCKLKLNVDAGPPLNVFIIQLFLLRDLLPLSYVECHWSIFKCSSSCRLEMS